MAHNTKEFQGAGKETYNQLENIAAQGYNLAQVFDDWLEIMLCTFQHPRREKQYLSTIRKYDNKRPIGKRPVDFFKNALWKLIEEVEKEQCDVLGNIFEQKISYGNNGQFLTPESLCELMAQLNNPKGQEHIADPACGSGRLLLATGKINPNAYFYGKDIDARCAKMTVLNLLFCDLKGTVEHGNTLQNTTYAVWIVRKRVTGRILHQLTEEELDAYVNQQVQWLEANRSPKPQAPPKVETKESETEKRVETTETQVTQTIDSPQKLSEGQQREIELAQEFGVDPLRFEEQQQMAEENLSEYEDLPLFAAQNE